MVVGRHFDKLASQREVAWFGAYKLVPASSALSERPRVHSEEMSYNKNKETWRGGFLDMDVVAPSWSMYRRSDLRLYSSRAFNVRNRNAKDKLAQSSLEVQKAIASIC